MDLRKKLTVKSAAIVVVLLFSTVITVGGVVGIPDVQAQQGQSSDFRLEYMRSGGIAGIEERYTVEAQNSSDSGANNNNTITFYKDGTGVTKMLSGESLAMIKQAVTESEFFGLNASYPPREGNGTAADYFSYSLAIAMNGQNHSVSWVDDFASATPVPPGLKAIVKALGDAYANGTSMQGPLDDGRRRVTETVVRHSTSHDAQGHSAHQAAYLLLAQPGYIYNGAVTFSSSRPVDILVYHDITGTNATAITGIAVHVVDGRSYAVTTVLRNVTSGSMSFVGTGILAHTATGDPYTLVATIDAIRKTYTLPLSEKSFTLEVSGEQFVVRATESETISQLTDNFNGRNSMHVTGRLVQGDGGFNQPWGWHLDPSTVRMADVSTEVCDGRPSMVQEDLDYWLGTVGNYCPWGSKVVAVN